MDIEQLRELIQLMTDHDLTELEVQDGKSRILLKRGTGSQVQQVIVPAHALPPAHGAGAGAPVGEPKPAVDENLAEIVSPMVGTYYSASSPDTPPFVTVGHRVTEGTTVCIVEAMKVFNEIKSEVAGTIAKILVNNGEAVEYGQPLFLVKLDAEQGAGNEHGG
jgi:acetyl-CoA carboxylase biotin carboxyl carrier protein